MQTVAVPWLTLCGVMHIQVYKLKFYYCECRLQTNLLLRFCGGSLKDCVKAVMNRLFSNGVMSYVSMHGRNYGKVAFGKTRICGLVVGKSNKFPTLWLVV